MVERQVGAQLGAEDQRLGGRACAAQEDGHRHDAVGVEHDGEVEAVLRQPVDRELAVDRLLLHHEQDGLAAAVGPLDEQRRVELPEAVAQALLELLLPQRDDPQLVVGPRRLVGGEQRERVAGILDDQVLEVLVVADRVRHALRPAFRSAKRMERVPGHPLWVIAESPVGDR